MSWIPVTVAWCVLYAVGLSLILVAFGALKDQRRQPGVRGAYWVGWVLITWLGYLSRLPRIGGFTGHALTLLGSMVAWSAGVGAILGFIGTMASVIFVSRLRAKGEDARYWLIPLHGAVAMFGGAVLGAVIAVVRAVV